MKKWEQIDDEIWGKIICMERNRRIAKAYARVPVLTVSGSDDGFDGFKIGLNGFDRAPSRDPLVKRVRDHIGEVRRINQLEESFCQPILLFTFFREFELKWMNLVTL